MKTEKKKPFIMGCYGIGSAVLLRRRLNRIMTRMGLSGRYRLPPSATILALGQEQQAAAEEIYQELTAVGVEVLYDDRDERPGVKFKDADLIGILSITIGPKD